MNSSASKPGHPHPAGTQKGPLRLESIEPEALFVFKLGPIAVEEDEALTHAYFAIEGSGPPHLPITAEHDESGLTELARQFSGRRIYCEPQLARAGARHGFIPRAFPPELFPVRAILALTMQWGPLAPRLAPELIVQFLGAAKQLWEAHPWKWWTNVELLEVRLEGAVRGQREACVLGNGEQEFGVSLYEHRGSVARLSELVRDGLMMDAMLLEGLALTFGDEPDWVLGAVREATGLPMFPMPIRTSPKGFASMKAKEMLVLVAVTRATALLTPEQLESRAEAVLGSQRVTANIRAHVPLFTARFPVPPGLPSRPGPAALSAPARAVPPREPSEALLEFVKPFFPEPRTVDPEWFEDVLELAVTLWNAAVLDSQEPGLERVAAVRAAVQSLAPYLRDPLLPVVEALVLRKRAFFEDSSWLMGGLQVSWERNGDVRIRLEAHIPDWMRP